LNENNGLGLPTDVPSGSEGGSPRYAFSQTTHVGVCEMNPSSSNIETYGVMAAPQIFLQAGYQNCLRRYGY